MIYSIETEVAFVEHINYWYDRNNRVWCAQLVDKHNNDISHIDCESDKNVLTSKMRRKYPDALLRKLKPVSIR